MHPVQSMSSFSFSTMSSLEDHLEDLGSKDVQNESSFPMLYLFEFEFGPSSSVEEEESDDRPSVGPRNQEDKIPNFLEKWQQSDQACCGISLTNEEEFSVSLNQSSSFEPDDGDSGSSVVSFSASHDGERHRQSHRWQKNLIVPTTRGNKSQGMRQETRRKLRRLKASGIDSVELAACPRVHRHRRISSSSLLSGPNNKKLASMIPLPSEIDSLVISMKRLSKHKEQHQLEGGSGDSGSPQQEHATTPFSIDSSS